MSHFLPKGIFSQFISSFNSPIFFHIKNSVKVVQFVQFVQFRCAILPYGSGEGAEKGKFRLFMCMTITMRLNASAGSLAPAPLPSLGETSRLRPSPGTSLKLLIPRGRQDGKFPGPVEADDGRLPCLAGDSFHPKFRRLL